MNMTPGMMGTASQMRAPHHASHTHPSTLLHGAPLQPHPVRPTANTHYLAYHQYLLQQVMRDEVAIQQRKSNVKRFGATWIRPPGVVKTLQVKLEEEQEKKEAAEQARREAMMQDLLSAQEEAARRAEQEAQGGEEVDEMERDLDAEVPEAADDEDEDEDDDDDDDDEDDEDEDEDDEEEEEEEEEPPVMSRSQNHRTSTYANEENLLHGSFVGGDEDLAPGATRHFLDAEDAEIDGRAQDMRDFGVVERDLDNDVPEAEGWEHTDTEEEDSSGAEDEDEDLTGQINTQEVTEDLDLESSFHIVTRRRSRRGGRQSGGGLQAAQQSRSSFGTPQQMEVTTPSSAPRDRSWLMRRFRGARTGG
jgi:hypothetical protein